MNTKTKTILLVAGALAIGLFFGWLIFGSSATEEHAHTEAQAAEYTCSMHPQIRQNEPGKCPICGMDLIPVTKSSGASNPFVHEMTPEAVALANIQTTTVKSVSASNELSLTGKIQVNEQQISVVTAKFPGRIEKLFINFEGQAVRKGEKIATIYSPELVTAQRELLEAKTLKNISPQLLEAAREKLRLWKITDKQIEQIEQSNDVLTNLDIVSEVSGYVTKRQVSVGDYLTTGTIIAELANLSTVWVVLDAFESDLPWIKNGASFSFSVPSLPGKKFNANIQYINPVLNPDTRSVDVRAVVSNPENLLKPEMLVNATLQAKMNTTQKGLAIPATAVLWTGKRSIVYVKQPGDVPSFERKEVTLGAKMGDLYIVEKGLTEGEVIVSNGVFAVDASAQLSGQYSMMNAPQIKSLEVPDAFQAQLTQVIDSYYGVKNSLVQSDKNTTAASALQVLATLKKVDMKLLDENAHTEWMSLLKPIEQSANGIAKGASIEDQRKSFQLLSNSLIEAVELFGITNERAYKAYCPMAFDNTGANWLSEIEDIKNPYFGSAMLTCGENKAVYKKNEPVFDTGEKSKTSSEHVH